MLPYCLTIELSFQANLLSAMVPCYQRLTEEELKRNTHGPMLVYNWTPQNLGTDNVTFINGLRIEQPLSRFGRTQVIFRFIQTYGFIIYGRIIKC